ncbi:MAG: hypothetical protein LC808_14305 [Actinobacteria bacterium]|nr:hypothetical protein [Actinomycetota bacterium]
MAYEMSIEVLDGEFPAHLWIEAHGDSLVEAALQCGVIEWRWQHFDWGVVLEIDFADESGWERFRAGTAVQAALDGVPDRFSGLLIYRGRGGSSAPRMPRKPRPRSGAGAVALNSQTSGCSSPQRSRLRSATSRRPRLPDPHG